MSRFINLMLVAAALFAFGAHQTNAHGTAASATLSPTTASINADQTQAFVMTATAADGHVTDVTSESVFSTNDPLGAMTGAIYHPGKVGTWTILAVYQSFSQSATVTVTAGDVKELSINPNSDPETVNRGAKRTFTVRAYDAASNPVENPSVAWSVIGDMGTITAGGVFTAANNGTGKVVATIGAMAAEVTVVVKDPETPLVANTNTTPTNTNTAAPANTNTAPPANTNDTPANTNTTITPTSDVATGTEECRTMANWVWVIILIAYLLGVAVLFAFIPAMKIWPALIALAGAAGLVVVQRSYGCNLLEWWAWVLALGTLGLTIMAARQMPMNRP